MTSSPFFTWILTGNHLVLCVVCMWEREGGGRGGGIASRVSSSEYYSSE